MSRKVFDQAGRGHQFDPGQRLAIGRKDTVIDAAFDAQPARPWPA